MTISAGDKVVLSASLVASPFRQSTTVKDLTTGVTYGQASTVDPIKAVNVFGGARSLGDSIADFGTIEWVNATFEGSSLGSANPEGLNMINNPGHPKLLVGTSALSPSGSSFKNIWVRGS